MIVELKHKGIRRRLKGKIRKEEGREEWSQEERRWSGAAAWRGVKVLLRTSNDHAGLPRVPGLPLRAHVIRGVWVVNAGVRRAFAFSSARTLCSFTSRAAVPPRVILPAGARPGHCRWGHVKEGKNPAFPSSHTRPRWNYITPTPYVTIHPRIFTRSKQSNDN